MRVNLHPPKTLRSALKTEVGQNLPDDKKEQIKIEKEGVREERTTVGEEKRVKRSVFFNN